MEIRNYAGSDIRATLESTSCILCPDVTTFREGFTVSVISIRDGAHFRHFRSEGATLGMFFPPFILRVRHAPTFYCYTRSTIRARARAHEGRQEARAARGLSIISLFFLACNKCIFRIDPPLSVKLTIPRFVIITTNSLNI